MRKLAFIVFAVVFVTLANATSAEIKIENADAVFETNLRSVSIPTQAAPRTKLFINSEDAVSIIVLSTVSIPTQATPLARIFINSEDAVLTKDLSSISIPTQAKSVTSLFIVNADAVLTKQLVPRREQPPIVTPAIPDFTARLELTRGINMISLPLNPDTPYTASTLAETLNSTIVIQVKDGLFDAYVHEGRIGNDFDIQMGKGYIVNLMEAKTFEITGKPWGESVPAAPSARNRVFEKNSVSIKPWAFVIAGRLEGTVPDGGRLRITNLRTGEKLVVPIPSVEQAANLLEKNELAARSTGEFTAAFVDMNRRPVTAEGDEFTIQLIGMGGVSLTEAKRYIISHEQIANAYLLVHFSAEPERTKLLQNYPNPFNPETWIPFQLAKPADVTIQIFDLYGRKVRSLSLGRKAAGMYVHRNRAAYWDGRNEHGEKVASGVYFYVLKAGQFQAVRKLCVVK